MIEEDAVACKNPVAFTVNASHPVAVKLGGGIRTGRLERGLLCLGDVVSAAVQFAG